VLRGGAALPFLAASGVCASPAPPHNLRVSHRVIAVNGKAATVYGITVDGQRQPLSLLVNQPFRVRLENATGVDTLLHWHGLKPPSAQDGVPMLTQDAVAPGGFSDYDFVNTRSGTHWMHSHLGLQEQLLLAAPLIVHETEAPLFEELEHVVMLHDFTFRPAEEILAELKAGGGGHAMHSMSNMDHAKMMPGMAMAGMTSDVAFDAYLANDRTLDDPEVVAVAANQTVRLRIINGAAASNMWIDLGRLSGALIAVDGNAVLPVTGSRFPLAIAQRADIRLSMPTAGGAFPILFQAEGQTLRTGLILASPGAAITRIDPAAAAAPALDLALEKRLRSVAELAPEPVTRTEFLRLTGGSENYLWGLNGQSGMHDTLFRVREGERVEVVMVNETVMAHPMHLHGHYFKVVNIDGAALSGALRDTVLVPPGSAVTIRFDADNPGNWAFHCHHLYHMNSGMMGAMRYSSAA
jgi:FtsP/CotA-like multicopper oxidase with cupredoxin domain